MSVEKVLVTWKDLKAMGWPYSKAHTWRMMQPTTFRTKGKRSNGTYREWHEPNEHPFPRCRKLGKFRNSPPVWKLDDVRSFLEFLGLL